MLIVILGVSCSGKTTIMNILNHNYKWKFIEIYTTREPRIDDSKIYMHESDYKLKLYKNEIIFSNDFYGRKYGCKKSDIDKSLSNNSDIYMLDFGIENIFQLNSLKNVKKIILLPEHKKQLKEQIMSSNRCYREKEILDEYTKLYFNIKKEFLEKNNCHCLINYKDDCINTSIKIHNIINE